MKTVDSARNNQEDAQPAGELKQPVHADALSNLNGPPLDLLPVAVYFCDTKGVLVRWNQQAVDLWGRKPKAGDPPERFCGSYKLYRTDGTFMAHGNCPIADALRTGQSQSNVEAILERPDGSRRFILANTNAIRDQAGAVIGAVNILQDITDRRQAEKELQDARSRLEAALEAGAIVTWTWNIPSNRLSPNGKIASLLNLAPTDAEDGCGASTYKSSIPDDRPRVSAALSRSIESGENYEADYRCPASGRLRAVGGGPWPRRAGRNRSSCADAGCAGGYH